MSSTDWIYDRVLIPVFDLSGSTMHECGILSVQTNSNGATWTTATYAD